MGREERFVLRRARPVSAASHNAGKDQGYRTRRISHQLTRYDAHHLRGAVPLSGGVGSGAGQVRSVGSLILVGLAYSARLSSQVSAQSTTPITTSQPAMA